MLNFSELENEIVEASVAALQEVVKNHLEEKVCAFALYSDDGAMTICPSINTVEHLETCRKENSEDALYFKFATAEWKYEAVNANELFDEICKKVSSEVFKEDENFPEFKRQLFETCGQALIVLKKRIENISEIDKDILMLFAVSDSEIDDKQIQLAKLLNSKSNFTEFETWAKQPCI